jgi:glycosyltransferase involved in cell wall biosynthesis
MRVLQVNAHHRKAGGAEVYLHQLVDALRERGHTVGLFAQEAEYERDEPDLRVVERAAFDPARLILDEAFAREFRAFARAFRPDVVHVHNLHVFPATFPAVLAELGAPVLLHPHEFGLLCPNAWCTWPDGTPCNGGPGRQCFEHDCSRNYPIDARNVVTARVRYLHARAAADAVVCGSDSLSEKMRAHGFRDVRTLRYFAEPAKFGGEEGLARVRAANPRERDRLLFLGRLEPEKGIGTLLAAMPTVLRARPHARLAVVGGGTLKGALERQVVELGLGAAVELPGPVPHTEVPPLLARASVQILPSIWAENAAQSCYDCLMLGLPLVASRVAALPEVVRDGVNGLLFAPRDPADLARAIVRVLDDPELAARLSAGCAQELARYDKTVHMDALEALYAELLDAPRPERTVPVDPELEFALEGLDGLLLAKENVFVETLAECEKRGAAHAEVYAYARGKERELAAAHRDRPAPEPLITPMSAPARPLPGSAKVRRLLRRFRTTFLSR